MVCLEALQELGLHMHTYALACSTCLDIGGMLPELFTEIPLLVLILTLVIKLSLVYSRNLETKPPVVSLGVLNQKQSLAFI